MRPAAMIPSEYEKLNRLQSKYWWFRGKRHLVQSFMERTYSDRRDLRILDVGCGTGQITQVLAGFGEASGVDASEYALDFCRQNGLNDLKVGSVCEIPHKSEHFDLVTLINVLYHQAVADDEQA